MTTSQRIAIVAFSMVASGILAAAFYVATPAWADNALTAAVSTAVAVLASCPIALFLSRKALRNKSNGGTRIRDGRGRSLE
jgi:hypothetical protein